MGEQSIVIYFHPTCYTSYRVIKHLAARGLLDNVVLVDTSMVGLSNVLKDNVWSVPWIVYNGVPAATDPVEPEEVEDLVLGRKPKPPKNPLEAFMNAVLHSAYAASLVYLHDSIKPVLSPALASAATRAPLTGVDPEDVVREAAVKEKSLLSSWRDKLVKALSYSFVREAWWAHRGSLDKEELQVFARPEVVGLWLLAKASIGRSGLPPRPFPDRRRVEKLANHVRKNAEKLLSRVSREQGEILGDEEYWETLREKTAWSIVEEA